MYGRPQRVAQMPDKLSKEALMLIRSFSRQALHASELGFVHPVNKKYLDFKVPFPNDLRNLEILLEKAVGERSRINL